MPRSRRPTRCRSPPSSPTRATSTSRRSPSRSRCRAAPPIPGPSTWPPAAPRRVVLAVDPRYPRPELRPDRLGHRPGRAGGPDRDHQDVHDQSGARLDRIVDRRHRIGEGSKKKKGHQQEGFEPVADSITITDNRTGESVEIPIVNGGVAATDWGKLLPGVWFYDPGFMSTAACESAITYLDGDAGILRYRGYPIEQLAEQLDLPRGGLPAAARRAADDRTVRATGSTRSRTTRSSTRTCASGSSRASTTTPTRWACSSPPSPRCRRSTSTPRTSSTRTSRNKQIIRLIAKMPTLAAAAHRFSVGMPFVYPDNSLDFAANFLSMMWKVAEPRFEADPVLARAIDVLFILHADHEQNCSTTAMRVVGSSHADPYSATRGRGGRPLRSAPRRRQRGRHQDADRDRLDRERPGLRRRRSRRATAGSRGSATASTRATTPGPRSSSGPPTTSSRSPARTRSSTSPSSSRRSPSPTSTSPPGASTRTSTSTPA